MSIAEAGIAVVILLGVFVGVWVLLQKKAPEGNSQDITNGETLL